MNPTEHDGLRRGAECAIIVAGYASEEAALADLCDVESVLGGGRVTPGRAVVVAPVGDGTFRLVGSVRGRRSVVLESAEFGWWMVEPIWLWVSTALLSGVDGSARRRHAQERLAEVERAAGASSASVVICTSVENRDAARSALGGAEALLDWSVRVTWSDVSRTLGLGRVAQWHVARSGGLRR